MKKMLLIICLTISTTLFAQNSALVIGGVLDLTVPEAGSAGKALELVAIDDIADLSFYAVGVANNGGGTDGLEANLPAVALAKGESFWFLRDTSAYQNYFGDIFGVYNVNYAIDGDVSQNGDDAIELFMISGGVETVVDVYGDPDVDAITS